MRAVEHMPKNVVKYCFLLARSSIQPTVCVCVCFWQSCMSLI